VIFGNLLRVWEHVWFGTIPLRLIEIEFIPKFWYFWNIFLSLRNRKKRKLRRYSRTFCEYVDMHGLVQTLWDWLRLNLWWDFSINSISINLNTTPSSHICSHTHKRFLNITSAFFSFYFKEIERYFKNINFLV
jgi:hypothetical protein